MEAILLNTPPQHEQADPRVETRERHVRKWLDQLPVLNIPFAVGILHDTLLALNQQPIPAKNRVKLLELYYKPVSAIFKSFSEQQLRQTPIPTADRRLVTAKVGSLCQRLADGYKVLIREGREGRRDPLKDAGQLLAVFRAMEQLNRALMHAYRCYATVPPQVLHEIHQLYLLAESVGVQDRPVVVNRDRGGARTIAHLYKRVLLLALSDPFHLAEGHAVRWFDLLDGWASLCPLSADLESLPVKDQRFVIDLGGDGPPVPWGHARTEDESLLRVLATRPLAEAVAIELKGLEALHTLRDHAPTIRLLRMLLPNLQGPRQRASPRRPAHRAVQVAIGMHAIVHCLAGTGRRRESVDASNAHGIEVRDLDSYSAEEYVLEEWWVENESIRGYLLSKDRGSCDDLRIGDLLGIAAPARNKRKGPLSLAVVRWVRAATNGRIAMGVETIPGKPAPVRCSPVDDRDPPVETALLLPQIESLKLPATVIARKDFYVDGQSFMYTSEATQCQATMGDRLLDTACVDQFVAQPQG